MKPHMRKGLLNEVRSVFDAAIEMTGCGDPAEMDREQERLIKLRREVETLLRLTNYVVRVPGRHRVQLTRRATLVECNVCGAKSGRPCKGTCNQQLYSASYVEAAWPEEDL